MGVLPDPRQAAARVCAAAQGEAGTVPRQLVGEAGGLQRADGKCAPQPARTQTHRNSLMHETTTRCMKADASRSARRLGLSSMQSPNGRAMNTVRFSNILCFRCSSGRNAVRQCWRTCLFSRLVNVAFSLYGESRDLLHVYVQVSCPYRTYVFKCQVDCGLGDV